MNATEAKMMAPRPVRRRRKWPPPGTSQPSTSAGSHLPAGTAGALVVIWVSAIPFMVTTRSIHPASLAGRGELLLRGMAWKRLVARGLGWARVRLANDGPV